VRLLPVWVSYLFPGHLVVGVALLITISLLGASTLRYGSLDPSLVIRRTALYGVSGVLLVFLVGVLQNVMLVQLADGLGISSGVSTWIAAGSITAIWTPFHKRIRVRTNNILDSIMPLTALVTAPKRTSVIVFSDLVGYSRLSVVEPITALTLVTLLDRAAHQVTRANQGRVVKTLGDGVMLEFSNADAAVDAGIQIRQLVQDACKHAGLPLAELRTGIHVGDVAVRRDGDLFGEVVNLAARLQAAATPGQLLISGGVAGIIALGRYTLTDLGERHLTNLPAPVRCFGVTV